MSCVSEKEVSEDDIYRKIKWKLEDIRIGPTCSSDHCPLTGPRVFPPTPANSDHCIALLGLGLTLGLLSPVWIL